MFDVYHICSPYSLLSLSLSLYPSLFNSNHNFLYFILINWHNHSFVCQSFVKPSSSSHISLLIHLRILSAFYSPRGRINSRLNSSSFRSSQVGLPIHNLDNEDILGTRSFSCSNLRRCLSCPLRRIDSSCFLPHTHHSQGQWSVTSGSPPFHDISNNN